MVRKENTCNRGKMVILLKEVWINYVDMCVYTNTYRYTERDIQRLISYLG